MSKVGKMGRIFIFILFISKQTKIKKPTKIKKFTNRTFSSTLANAQLLNNNCSKLLFKINLLNQVVNINDNLSKLESIAKSEADLNFDKKVDLFLML